MKQILVSACVGLVALAAMLTARPAAAQSLHQCASCHQLHGTAGFNRLLKQDVVETLCLTCHGPAGISTLKAAVHTNKARGSVYPVFSMSCRVCHDPHSIQKKNWLGTTNIKQVGSKQDSTNLARILTPNSGIREVVFRSRGSGVGEPTLHSFADNDQDANGYNDGICQTCHTRALNHRNDGTGDQTHNVGKTCTRCHEHVNGFNR